MAQTRLLISTINKGLYRLEKGQYRPILSAADKLGSDIYVLLPGRDGSLWFGTDDGLYHYLDNRLLNCSSPLGLNANITALIEDRDDNLWMGSEGGLFRYQNGHLESLSRGHGLDSNYVYSVCEDAEGSIWLGTVDGGLTQIRDEKITTFTEREGLSGDKFRCFHADGAGALWMGGSGGYISRYQNGGFENFRLPVVKKSYDVNSMETDADGFTVAGDGRGANALL